MAQIYCFLKGEKEWITQKVKKKLEKTKTREEKRKKKAHTSTLESVSASLCLISLPIEIAKHLYLISP
jgi:hypothetical protein